MEELNETYETFVPRKIELGTWQEWFAWRPVKVKGKRVWLKKVFRRCINTYVDHDDWTRYEYGTAFDVIKGDSAQTFVGQEPTQSTPAFKGQQDG